jgi:excinuclease ABC subunit C
MNGHLKLQLKNLPVSPGVYLYRDASRKILYVGKAKKLRNRVRSYFQRTRDLTPEKQLLVRDIADIETILVSSETEALLLEATLIKRHQPPHNIVLRDDKSFLYVRIPLDDPFPPVELVRGFNTKDRARYFGPYTSAGAIRGTLKMLRRIFPYRTCSNPPDKPCFDAHLNRCAGHDLTPTSREDYQKIISGLIRFLEGHGRDVVRDLTLAMKIASRERRFEAAAVARDRLRAVHSVLAEQNVVSPSNEHEDYLSLLRVDDAAHVNLFRVRQGKLMDREFFTLQHSRDASDAEVVGAFLEQYYSQSADHPKRVNVPVYPTERERIETALQLRLAVPVRGRKRKLMAMGLNNARAILASRRPNERLSSTSRQKALDEIAAALKLSQAPARIECYDISNVQGAFPVGSMVVVEDGLPKKSDYRKFSIKTIKGPDDFHMMAEMLSRRLAREDWPRPDLIVLDGGKGQLSVVRANVKTTIPIVALAKREEEVFVPGRADSIRLPRDSEGLFLLQRIRDEAHRFAIGTYRKQHGRGTVRSRLDEIAGIGPKTKKALLKAFGSTDRIRAATDSELDRLVGPARRERIRQSL